MDKITLANLKKTKTPEQIQVIMYFDPVAKGGPLKLIMGLALVGAIIGSFIDSIVGSEGAIAVVLFIAGAIAGYILHNKKFKTTGMTDAEYDALVQNKIKDSKAKALSKIGLDEDEVKEIAPADFEGYNREAKYARKRADGSVVRSCYEKTWLFFSNTQVYFWNFKFHLDKDSKKEDTQEYFYKDVTSFSTSSESKKTKIYIPPQSCREKIGTTKEEEVNYTMFTLVVPNDKQEVAMENTDANNNKVQAMKQKLREKKQG
jgi:F0F1-type ATP synthase assembly protein I